MATKQMIVCVNFSICYRKRDEIVVNAAWSDVAIDAYILALHKGRALNADILDQKVAAVIAKAIQTVCRCFCSTGTIRCIRLQTLRPKRLVFGASDSRGARFGSGSSYQLIVIVIDARTDTHDRPNSGHKHGK